MHPSAIEILLVEDSPSDAYLLQEALQQTGSGLFEFTWVERLDDAIARLRQQSFDMLLLDLSLPDSSGPDTFRRARKAAPPRLPILVLTGVDDESLGLAAVHEGIQDYLVKGQTDGRQIARAIRYAIERKHAEEQLRQQREWLRVTLISIGDAVLATDTAGKITFLNPVAAKLTGWPQEQALGHPVQEVFRIINEKTHEKAEDTVGRVLWEGRVISLADHTALVTRDGYEIPIEDSAAPIRDNSGNVAGAVLVFHDVTERKRAEERLRQAQKLESVGQLAGGIAHDFNNLLIGVIGSASLAQDIVPPGSPVAELLDRILKTGEQLANLTRQMLAYSGKGRFFLESLNLSDVIPEMSPIVQPSIPKKIELRLELESGVPPIQADRGQLQQVFMNLVLNAAEAIGSETGLIVVKTGLQQVDDRYAADLVPGKYVYLEVRDSGCGMDDATKARIFDPFFSTKFIGRGLGLAAVSGIVRGHKGAITVTSAPGKGSSFTVLFPVAADAVAVSPVAAPKAKVGGNGTVLVVDDEVIVREVAKTTLEQYGHRVLLAENGLAAIDVFKRHAEEVALVVLDLSMPGMGGEEVLPRLRRLRPSVKVIVSSGYDEAETMAFFKGQQVSGFIQKPYTSSKLADKVKSALR